MFIKLITILILLVAAFAQAANQPFEEYLSKQYGKCLSKRENVFLEKKFKTTLQDKLNTNVSALLVAYQNKCNKTQIYVDSHVVRTNTETVVIELNKNNIINMKVTAFMEPPEYLPPGKWLEQFKRTEQVDALTGSTLTQNAIKTLAKKYKLVQQHFYDKK